MTVVVLVISQPCWVKEKRSVTCVMVGVGVNPLGLLVMKRESRYGLHYVLSYSVYSTRDNHSVTTRGRPKTKRD
jgi:hypothetical protein